MKLDRVTLETILHTSINQGLHETDGINYCADTIRRAVCNEQRNSRWKGTNSRASKGRGKGTRGDTGDGDDEEGEMEVNTKHEELVYWYTGFEDPNCIAVVELVATIMDIDNGVQVHPPD